MGIASRAAAVIVCAGLPCVAFGQLTPDRTYYGINQPAPITVKVPKASKAVKDEPAEGSEPNSRPGTDVQADLSAVIELYTWGNSAPISSASVIEGKVDLAALFPELWTSNRPQVQFAQLRVGTEKIGPSVVLVPMITPPKAQLFDSASRQAWFIDPSTGQQNFDPRKCELSFTRPAANYSGIKAYVDQTIVFTTSEGEMEFRMRPDQAPNTVYNLLELVRGGFFTQIPVHRVVAKLPTTGHPFVIQFGDPTGGGDGGPGYSIDLENSQLAHDFGVLSMARDDDPDTNGSQVFICLSREGTSRLDGKYTAFAEAIGGLETIEKLAGVKTDERTQRPLKMPMIESARLEPAAPFGNGPSPLKRTSQPGR